MKYDGSEKEVIFKGLHWPEAITIDNEGELNVILKTDKSKTSIFSNLF